MLISTFLLFLMRARGWRTVYRTTWNVWRGNNTLPHHHRQIHQENHQKHHTTLQRRKAASRQMHSRSQPQPDDWHFQTVPRNRQERERTQDNKHRRTGHRLQPRNRQSNRLHTHRWKDRRLSPHRLRIKHGYGGNSKSSMHWDFVTHPSATIEIAGTEEIIMRDGKIL